MLWTVIHETTRASHVSMIGGSKEAWLVLAEAEDDRKHNGVACVKQELAEESISNFKKFDPKSLTNLVN